jgi:hypothetical protein
MLGLIMAMGPGKYDDVCSMVREQVGLTRRGGVLVIVMGGEKGPGFSYQGDLATMALLPPLLEDVARQIREEAKKEKDRAQ